MSALPLGAERVLRPLVKLVIAGLLSAVLLALILNGIRGPVKGGVKDYTAEFTDVAGLRPNADVRIRGVKVGKVTTIEMVQDEDNQALGRVHFTLLDHHTLTDASKAGVKYANLSGVRYLDIDGADGDGRAVTALGVENTVPSFDITELFNGLQPVLATLSPEEINTFSDNALLLMQGDGAGLAPMLDSINKLGRFAADRKTVISTLVANMSRISESLGGMSPAFLQFLREIERPIDSTLTVLDEFRKADLYGPSFLGTVSSILTTLGITPTTDIDKELTKAFPTVNNLWKSLELLPIVTSSLAMPAASAQNRCSGGALPLPELGRVLINGSGVVVCRK